MASPLVAPVLDDTSTGRTLRRSRALPNGRALLGALLITVAAVAAFAVAQRDGTPQAGFVVATRAVAPGARLTAADLAVRPMDLPDDVRAVAFADPSRLVGAVALGPLGAGQLVQVAEVALADAAGATAARHEVTFPVSRDRVPAGLRRGEKVAVLATFGTGADARTVVSAADAVVLAFDAESDGIGGARQARITVALPDPATVLDTVHATQVAEVSIVRATLADGAALAGRATSPGAPTTTRAATGAAPVATLTGGGVR